jgi:hypothetical protein
MLNGMDSKRKGSQVFNNNPQGSRLREGPKNRWWNYKRILINAKLQIGKRGQRAELTGRSPFRRWRSALDCSAIEEEEEEEEGGERGRGGKKCAVKVNEEERYKRRMRRNGEKKDVLNRKQR